MSDTQTQTDAMSSSTVRIINDTWDDHAYTLCLDGVYIPESSRNVLISPVIKPGSFYDWVLDSRLYVWAKLAHSSEEIISEMRLGETIVLRNDGQRVDLQKLDSAGSSDSGGFLIRIDDSFLDGGSFGLGFKSGDSFHKITTAGRVKATTYRIQPVRVLQVAVNRLQLKSGEALPNGHRPKMPSVAVDLGGGCEEVAVSHGAHGLTEYLNIAYRDNTGGSVSQKTVKETQLDAIPASYAVAATSWPEWHMRIYFQEGHDRGYVLESRHDEGVWSGGDLGSAVVAAKIGSPLAVISWDDGKLIRLFYVTPDNILQERCYNEGSDWVDGALNNLSVRVAPYSKITAVHWPVDTSIRLFCQEPSSKAIQEYCYCNKDGWTRGTTLPDALEGSSLAATRWIEEPLNEAHRGLRIRLYYQDEQSCIRELCWMATGWGKGQYKQPALTATALAVESWFDRVANVRLLWQDNRKTLFESMLTAGGWQEPLAVAQHVEERSPFSIVKCRNGTHQRIYMHEDGTVVEKCDGGEAGAWFKGADVFLGHPKYSEQFVHV